MRLRRLALPAARRLARAMPPGLRRVARRLLTSLDAAVPGLALTRRHMVSDAEYAAWIRACDTLSESDRTAIRAHIARLGMRPLISVVIEAGDAAAASVHRQIYPHWEILPATDARLSDVGGAFVMFLNEHDRLAETALYEIAVELNAHPDADLIYGDEDRIDDAGHRRSPYFKPGWSIDLMLGQNLVNRTGAYRTALLRALGGAGDCRGTDLALRVAAASAPARIRHIPAILLHAREPETPRGTSGVATRVSLPDPAPRVSVIVPTRDRADLLETCAAGVLSGTAYPDIELIIVDNESRERPTLDLLERLGRDRRVRILRSAGNFNYSALNNEAAAAASGEVLALLNNDIEVIGPGWLAEMVGHALRPDVGAVGARLLYPDGTIQHAGVVLGISSFAGVPGVAGHFGVGTRPADPGYFGQTALTRDVAAVTGACLVMRKAVFAACGGLDAAHLPVAFNDIDLCLRLRAAGLRIIWTPHAELVHRESASRGSDQDPRRIARFRRDHDTMRERWGAVLDADPFYNENFSRADAAFRLAIPARRVKPWRVPGA